MGEDLSSTDDRKKILVQNERTKLSANAIDRLSTASIAAGFIAPTVSGERSDYRRILICAFHVDLAFERTRITFCSETCSWKA